MGLFGKLEKLYRPASNPLEDVNTEIVTRVLGNSRELTLAWLRAIGVTALKAARKHSVNAQESYPKLEGHDTDSRPDITIRIVADDHKELIFVESKLGSTAEPDQLEHYADHLARLKRSRAFAKVSLVYITRDFEAVNCPGRPGVAFTARRWYEFYQILKAHVNGDGLAQELKLFMEENRMSLGNQFRSTDLVAMESFLSAKALMDETLAGKVSVKAEKILGNFYKLDHYDETMKQLRLKHRYVVYSQYVHFDCAIGYWLPNESPETPVWVGIELGANPQTEVGKAAIQAFRNWAQKPGGSWSAENVDDEEWGRIRKGKPIQSLFSGPDHVRTIADYLLTLLDEVADFKKATPNLPWATSNVEAEAKTEL